MTTTDLAAALLRDVPLHDSHHDHGGWMYRTEVLAALTAAFDPAIAERAGVHLLHLRDDLGPWSKQSADLITALLAQNAALRAEVRKSAMDAVSAGCQAQEAWEAQKAAEAQIAALRAMEGRE